MIWRCQAGLFSGMRGRIIFNFGGEQESKINIRPFKKNTVNDFTKLSYESSQKLKIEEGKCLIYKNKRTVSRICWQFLSYWGPIGCMSALIYTNPFANIFPAAIPILCVLDLVALKLWLNSIKWNQNLVREIYLFENGEASEIWYENQWKRKLFGEDIKKIYYNSVFVSPDYDKQEILLLNKEDKVFPCSLEEAKKKEYGYSWVKHFSNGQNFLVIPKKAEYNNMEILIEIFKGKIIRFRVKE